MARKIDRDKFYTLWDLHPNGRTWMIDRTYSGEYFQRGSYGHQFLASKKHKVVAQGINPNKSPARWQQWSKKLTTSQRKERRKYVVYGGYGEPLGILNYGGYEYSDGLWPTEVAEEIYRNKRGSRIRVVPVGNVTDKVYELAKEVERSGDYRR
jgi:hypothetical protein